MNNKLLLAATCFSVFTMFGGAAEAAPIAYEGFDYAGATDLNTGLNGGTGWSGGWAETVGGVLGPTTSGTNQSLYFGQAGPLITDGSTHIFAGGNRASERDWTTAVDLASSDLYFTALIHFTTGADQANLRAEFWDGAGATGNRRANVGVTADTLYTHIQSGGYNPTGSGSASANLSDNTTYLLAMKRTGTGISASLILADGSSSTLASEPITWQVSDPGNSGVNLTSMRLIANGANGAIRIDELRIATDWDSVVDGLVIPEPGSLALLGLGGLLLARRRRDASS
ncbi:MAG: PEP-CTERM sorting domain-containing protein [Phycisphaeraceae bacterium]|nr:PEP-CTERM sorting domain-containing protein [Phycisphaeraceae bacterium]